MAQSQPSDLIFDSYSYKPPPSYEECMSSYPPPQPPQGPRTQDGLLGGLRPGQSQAVYGPTRTGTNVGDWAKKNKSTICGVLGAVSIFIIFILLAFIILSVANSNFRKQDDTWAYVEQKPNRYDGKIEYDSRLQITHHVPDISFPGVDPKEMEYLRKQLKNWNLNPSFLNPIGFSENDSGESKESTNTQQPALNSNNGAVTTNSDISLSEDDDQQIKDVQQQLKNWNLNPFFLNFNHFKNKSDDKK